MRTHALLKARKPGCDAVGENGPSGLAPGRFCDPERLALLRAPGVGPRVVSRLEEQGLTSLKTMREMGADRVIDLVCRAMGSPAWKNRHAALAKALSPSSPDHQPVPGNPPSHPSTMPAPD